MPDQSIHAHAVATKRNWHTHPPTRLVPHWRQPACPHPQAPAFTGCSQDVPARLNSNATKGPLDMQRRKLVERRLQLVEHLAPPEGQHLSIDVEISAKHIIKPSKQSQGLLQMKES